MSEQTLEEPSSPELKLSKKTTVDMQANFSRIKEIAARFSEDELADKESTVRDIVENVRKRGDEALKEYTKKFDGEDISDFRIPLKSYSANGDENSSYLSKLSLELRQALVDAKYRIRVFHKRDKQHNWSYEGNMKEKLGAIYTPIESVGIYVPGGEAPLVSTVLMTAIPAKVAGVKRVVMVSPPPINYAVLAAAELAGVDEVYSVGGAQAVANTR